MPAGWLLVGLTWSVVAAGFTASTANGPSSFSAGTVAISDDDSSTAMFVLTGLRPGDRGARCYAVYSSGTLPAEARLYVSGGSGVAVNGLSDHVRMRIDVGSGGSFASSGPLHCGTGFRSHTRVFDDRVTALGAYVDYASGLSLFTTTGATRTYTLRFSWVVDASAPTTSRSGSMTASLTVEARNT